MDRPDEFHVVLFTDADNFEPEEPIKKAPVQDKWEGEDEDEDVKVNHRDSHFIDTPSATAWFRAVCESPAGECHAHAERKDRRLGCDASLLSARQPEPPSLLASC